MGSLVDGVGFEPVVEQVLCDARVATGGGVGQVEDQGDVQWVGAGGQGLVQDLVFAYMFQVNAVAAEVKCEVARGDRLDPRTVFCEIRTCLLGVPGQVSRRWSSQASRVRWVRSPSRWGCPAR